MTTRGAATLIPNDLLLQGRQGVAVIGTSGGGFVLSSDDVLWLIVGLVDGLARYRVAQTYLATD